MVANYAAIYHTEADELGFVAAIRETLQSEKRMQIASLRWVRPGR